MKRNLTGQQSICAACGLAFKHTYGFDKHRTGPYTARRCLTVEELTEKGYAANEAGFWRKPKPESLCA